MAEERDPSSADSALGRALDSFLDWADGAHGLDGLGDLPGPHVLQGLGAGTLLGDFELVRQLGSGGMGVVFEARQRSVGGRRVALKILRDPFASRRLQARFRREIATIGSLEHPDVVPIVAAGVEDGVAYYAMRFLDGCSAARLIRELRSRVELPPAMASVRGRIAPAADDADPGGAWEGSYARWTARLALHLAEALQHAHDHGIVHRDVKPGNVVIRPGGRPVLIDFGLATGPVEQSLTRAGDFVGTLAYAAPEQVRGEPADARGDVYSLGATLYELLALRRPFEGSRRSELLRRIEHDDPPPLGAWVPADLRTICACALAKEARHRYASAGALAHDLREHLAGRPIRARPPGAAARAARWLRRRARRITARGSA